MTERQKRWCHALRRANSEAVGVRCVLRPLQLALHLPLNWKVRQNGMLSLPKGTSPPCVSLALEMTGANAGVKDHAR